jgi:hypothetical protein
MAGYVHRRCRPLNSIEVSPEKQIFPCELLDKILFLNKTQRNAARSKPQLFLESGNAFVFCSKDSIDLFFEELFKNDANMRAGFKS